MRTFQIFQTVSYEYFVEAETVEEAQTKIIEQQLAPDSEELIEWVYADEHDGVNWTYEPVTNVELVPHEEGCPAVDGFGCRCGVSIDTEMHYCAPCEDDKPHLDNACLVCGTFLKKETA